MSSTSSSSFSSWFSYETVEKATQIVGSATQLVEQQLSHATQLIANGTMEDDARTLGLAYITPRIIASSFPICAMYNSSEDGGGKGTRRVVDSRLPDFLRRHHGSGSKTPSDDQDKVLVWNLSEVSYEGLSAIEFRFPGHPSAPLGALFELCTSLDSWLNANTDPPQSNVALIHCLTGKGRTITVVACYLAWSGYLSMTPTQALNYVCDKKKLKVLEATIPSQRRYVEYFSRALDGVRPRSEAIMLKCARAGGTPQVCILQAYVDGNLVYSGKSTTSASGVVSFPSINTVLDGDVLLRVRVEDERSNKRISLFRVALHSGYTPSGTFRLEHGDLDGGNKDTWIELEFEPLPGTLSAAKLLSKGVATNDGAFWELVSRRRSDLRTREVERGNAAFALKSAPAMSAAAAATPTSAAAAAANDHGLEEEEEEEEEDDLEKELGELLEGKKSAPVPPSPAGKDDDLAELDDYFNKLGEDD